ncbi:MAG: twin-arginine translocase subunit TatB, partial [Rhodospirillaceae bacterium]|nr:twin-arginine translocase subunit TatB [Rhodospirillaceae bacterium]
MLDIGWTEILVIAVVAIVVIGPKDLPRTLRTVGQWIAQARGIPRDLQNSV